ncbi:MAG TPA: menaquinone biosynthesis protein [Gemmatimonadaceae bacterium]|jgi:chorismate dehydratase|nr:menaquinone biosynthesis protein [Gemmatimonadaceae bacterium]
MTSPERATMRIGRIPYINCYPVYGAIDRGIIALKNGAELVDGVPTALNKRMAEGTLDVSVVSAVEYARDWERYLLLPDLAISCDGAVRSVMLFSREPAESLGGRQVLVSRSSMTSVQLLEMLFENVWKTKPVFIAGDAEASDLRATDDADVAARLVIGDAALMLGTGAISSPYEHVYDLGLEWKKWTGLPFVFAVWVAQRTADAAQALAVHASLIESRNWGLKHLDVLAQQAHENTNVPLAACSEYLSGLDYGLSYPHLGGLTEFYRRLTLAGKVAPGRLAFLSAA